MFSPLGPSESPDVALSTIPTQGAHGDEQLTIRIPNPKMYIARQSQWKGRRGKPRCDHCRMNNLKCDRVLPTCNHCSWANGKECRYTPLPTPAHRGIPRCDRCRLANLKCDRSLPACSHCAGGGHSQCNYTPKKRHKVPLDHGSVGDGHAVLYGARTASFLVSDIPSNDDSPRSAGSSHDECGKSQDFYGQNIVPPSRPYSQGGSSTSARNGIKEGESIHPIRFAKERRWIPHSPLPNSLSCQPQNSRQISLIPHSPPPKQGAAANQSPVQLWIHPSFTPLPDVIVQCINSVNSNEMPGRAHFEETLTQFSVELPSDLRETSIFSPEVYASICCFLSGSNNVNLSDRQRMWLCYHHVRLGSEKRHLLLIPREPFFQHIAAEQDNLQSDYIALIDKHPHQRGWASDTPSPLQIVDHDVMEPSWAKVFERIPVLNQIYDILVYAHRAHGCSSFMLSETRRIGMAMITWPMVEIFIRLCPLCTLHPKLFQARHSKSKPVVEEFDGLYSVS